MAGAIQGLGGSGAVGPGAIGQVPGGVRGPATGAGAVPGQPEGVGGGSFADTLERALGEVSGLQEASQNAIQSFLRGESIELHQVMAAAEEAGIALEMLVEIRNKLTDAYRTVMQMQS